MQNLLLLCALQNPMCSLEVRSYILFIFVNVISEFLYIVTVTKAS